jgi:NitT/TauT family transport system substrate-binding protein
MIRRVIVEKHPQPSSMNGCSSPSQGAPMKRSSFARIAALAACVPAVPAFAQSTAVTIRAGTAPVESYALMLFAYEGGFFKKHGIDATVQIFNGGGAVMAAEAGGALDLACANWGAISNAYIKGIPIKVIAPGGLYSSEDPSTVLCVGKTSTIKTAKELNGKTVGVSTLKDLQQASVMKWVDANGGDSSTLHFLELPIPAMATALNAGRIDAGIILEPNLSGDKDKVRVLAQCYDAITKRLMICAHLVMQSYLEKNTDAVKRIAEALAETAVYANANHDKTAVWLEKYSKVPAAETMKMARTLYTDKLELGAIQPVIDASTQYKFIDHGFKASDVIWKG